MPDRHDSETCAIDRRRWTFRPRAAVAGLAIVLVSCPLACHRPGDLRDGAARLAAAAGAEGWIAGAPVVGVGGASANLLPGPEESRLRRQVAAVAGQRTAEGQALAGLLALHLRRPDSAVGLLEAASERSGDWRDHNDLAVARLERFRQQGEATDLVAALGAAQRARAARPDRPEAVFNRARVLSELGLDHAARDEWERLARLARTGGDEALARVVADWRARPEAPGGFGGRLTLRESLEDASPPDPGPVTAAVHRHPLAVHEYVRLDLVERWSAAVLTGRRGEAERALELGTVLGSELARSTGDGSVLRLYAYLARSCRSDGCARGHRDYAGGARAFLAGSFARAEADLTRAVAVLADEGSPFEPWARYYLAYVGFHRGIDDSAQVLDRLLKEGAAEEDGFLAGRLHWRLAVAEGSARRPGPALEHVEAGSRRMCGSTDDPGCAFQHTLLSEIHDLTGDVRTGWEHRLQALRQVLRHGTPRQVHSTLTVTLQALIQQGYGDLAGPFVGELARNAEHTGNPGFLTEVRREQGRFEASRGRLEEARRHFADGRRLARDLEPSPRQRQLLCTLDLAEGAAEVEADPARAVRLLDRAEAVEGCSGNAYFRLFILTHRAAARRALGEEARSLEDLSAALQTFEAQREASPEGGRVLALVAAQPLYDDLVGLLVRSGRPAAALSVAERSRNRFLLEARLRSSGHPGQVLTGPEIVDRLPGDTLLVQLAQLPDRLVAWVVARGELRAVEVPLGADEARRLVADLEGPFRAGLGEAELEARSSGLYRRLLAPLHLDLEGEGFGRLLVVPDRALMRLPFAALRDPRSGRLLIERVAVVTAPSASLVLGPVEVRRPAEHRPPLVVAAPDLAGTAAEPLPPLPGAFEEARRVVLHHPGATLLSRSAATREAFLEHAPGAAFVHFAGHALADAEAPFRSRLPLAAAGDGPAELDVGDLLEHRLPTPLVVLSACRTLSGFRVDREELLGLAGGFYVAGAAAVVATRWEAEDGTSPELMDAFHRFHAEGPSPSAAFRAAVARLRESDPEGRRPLARWANFVVLEGIHHPREETP